MRRRAILALALAPALDLAAPARAQTAPEPSTADLLDLLQAAPSDTAAAALEMQIRDRWAREASPAVRLLIARGRRELGENAASDAFDSFDAALDLDPKSVEAWIGRAEAQSNLGDYVGAAHDVESLLAVQPRSFVAFRELAAIAESRKDWKGALAAWQKLLELSPRTPGGQDRLADLKRRALGEEL